MGFVAVCIVVLGVIGMFVTAGLSWIVSWYPLQQSSTPETGQEILETRFTWNGLIET